MKKNIKGKKLSRSQGARKALYRSMIRSFVANGSLKSSKAKIQFIQPKIDSIITLGKKNDLNSRRKVYSYLGNDRLTTDLVFKKIATEFSDRNSGFTKTTDLGRRRGDNSEIVKLEWVKEIKLEDDKPKTKKEKKKAKKKVEKKEAKKQSKKGIAGLKGKLTRSK